MAFICIPLMIRDTEHLSKCTLAICMSMEKPICSGPLPIPSTGTNASYDICFDFFLRHLHTSFHTGFTNLHPHQQCMRVPSFPYPCPHLFLVFLILVILNGVRSYLVVILICISLMISDVEYLYFFEHLFMCPLAIYRSSLGEKRGYSGPLPIFNWIFQVLSYIISLCILEINTLSYIYHLQISSPI